MKSPLKRRLAIAALLLAPTLSACGFSAQTDQVYQAATGTNSRTGDVYILNATVVTDTDGTGTFAGTLENQTGDAQELTGVTGEGLKADIAGGEGIQITPFGYNNLGEAGDTVPPVKLAISGKTITPGGYVTLTFTFASGQSVTMKVPVVPVGTDYTDVPLPAPASDSSSPSDAPSAN